MEITSLNVVRSVAGRDQGKLFVVLSTDGEYLLLADGKGRKVESPKRKKRKHVQLVAAEADHLSSKIKCEENITNSELRRALAIIRQNSPTDQEG